jgi:hypothetical protein
LEGYPDTTTEGCGDGRCFPEIGEALRDRIGSMDLTQKQIPQSSSTVNVLADEGVLSEVLIKLLRIAGVLS